jgi:perosamine synthetase
VRYPVSKPWLTGNELEYVTRAVTDGWLSSQGPYVRRFESEFAAYNSVAHGVSCSSGTTALTIALRVLGVGPGDEVIVPEFTFVSTAWAVTYLGATPVFVDCADDLNIDVSLIREKITPRTKVIVPVHVYGRRCDMTSIMALAAEHDLRVVEDSAEAHGIRPVADIACFSLFANKIITSGEGGICLTNDPDLAERLAQLRGLGITNDHSYLHPEIAYNFRMTNLQAAVALAQVEQLEQILAIRRDIEKRYDAGLQSIAGITLMPPRDVLWMYDVLVENREELRRFLAAEGIETRVFFKPMSRQPTYLDPGWPALNASRFSEDGLHLPTYTGMTEVEQECVIAKIRQFYAGS